MINSQHPDQDEAALSQDARDRRLLNDVVGGNRDAMTELYNLYFPRVFSFLYRLSRDYCLAEEVVNDVMLVIWRDAARFKGSSKVSTWVLGIGYRQCMKRLRKQRVPQVQEQEIKAAEFDGCGIVELDDVLARALDQLTAEHRMMIESVLYLGMTYREVAEIVGCPVNTAKTRVHHGRIRLRAALAKMGYVHGEDLD